MKVEIDPCCLCPIDPGILPLVQALNNCGYKTYMSCAGHDDGRMDTLFPGEGWVQVDNGDFTALKGLMEGRFWLDAYIRWYHGPVEQSFLVISRGYLECEGIKFDWAVNDLIEGINRIRR